MAMPVTKATYRFSLYKFAGSTCTKPITIYGKYMQNSVCTPLENIFRSRNSFGLGPHFFQQNEHIIG